MAKSPGTIHGVGLGPGAQDLLSVRADRLVSVDGVSLPTSC